jgi:hypothetical protein
MVLSMALVCNVGIAQTKFFTKTGSISFFAKTNVENITAKKYRRPITFNGHFFFEQWCFLFKIFK